MGKAEQQQQITAIVQRFTDIAPADWVRLVGNWEASTDPTGQVMLNYLTLAVVNGGDRWIYGQLPYDEQLYDAVARLNELAAQDNPDHRWTVLDLEVDPDHTIRVTFGYDPPKRTQGVFDHESMGRFEGYLDSWVAEHGPRPAQ